jgi:hypothetical protein
MNAEMSATDLRGFTSLGASWANPKTRKFKGLSQNDWEIFFGKFKLPGRVENVFGKKMKANFELDPAHIS